MTSTDQLNESTNVDATNATECNQDAQNTPDFVATPETTATCAMQPRGDSSESTSSETAVSQAPVGTFDVQPQDPIPPVPEDPVAPLEELTPIQVRALDLLAAGMPLGQVARTLSIHRVTIHRWKTQHPAFIAGLNCRTQDAMDALGATAMRIVRRALTTLEDSLTAKKASKETRRDIALTVLRTFASRHLMPKPGPVTARAAARQLTLQPDPLVGDDLSTIPKAPTVRRD